MYNGIGLLTPRGSGTSGHVTSNSFNIRPSERGTERRGDALSRPLIKKPDERILEHARKREIEVKLMELEETLQEQGCVLNTPSPPPSAAAKPLSIALQPLGTF